MTAIEFCEEMREVLWQWEHRLITKDELRANIARINLQFTDGVEQMNIFDGSPADGEI